MTYERIDVSMIYAHLTWYYAFSLYVIAIMAYGYTVLKELKGGK